MALSSLSSTAKLVTGYEIPVVGFGVSISILSVAEGRLTSESENRSTKRMLLFKQLDYNELV